MGALEELADAIFEAATALYAPNCPEIAPLDPKDPEKSASGAIIDRYCYPKDPVYPPGRVCMPGQTLPSPQDSDLAGFLRGIRPFESLDRFRKPPQPHHPRWNTPWTRAEILDLERRRLAGASLRELGKSRGVSPARVAQVLAKARRHRQKARHRRRVRGVL